MGVTTERKIRSDRRKGRAFPEPTLARARAAARARPDHPALPKKRTLQFNQDVGLLNYADVFRMEPLDRIAVIRSGVDPESFVEVAKSMQRSKTSFAKMLGLAATTVDRKLQKGQRLTPEQSEPLVSAAKLIGQVQTMIEESGNPEGFNAAQWFATWLDRPLTALGGHRPAELMSTAEGRELVSKLLDTAQSAAYV